MHMIFSATGWIIIGDFLHDIRDSRNLVYVFSSFVGRENRFRLIIYYSSLGIRIYLLLKIVSIVLSIFSEQLGTRTIRIRQ